MRGSASPLRIASASVTTAPSTHPPLTLPATSPFSFTAIAAPGPRGPDPSTSTTRASATFVPADRQRSRSSRISRISSSVLHVSSLLVEHVGQLLHRSQRVPFHEPVNVRQRRRHPTGQRGV